MRVALTALGRRAAGGRHCVKGPAAASMAVKGGPGVPELVVTHTYVRRSGGLGVEL